MNKVISRQIKLLRIISIAAIGLGIILLAYMITFEDEPGAIPLILIIAGSIGYFINRRWIKKT